MFGSSTGYSFEIEEPCYVKDNMDWAGPDKYNQGNVNTLAECMGICRERNIKVFVWVHRDTRCVCKDETAVTNEKTDQCCVSGHATGGACESEPTCNVDSVDVLLYASL